MSKKPDPRDTDYLRVRVRSRLLRGVPVETRDWFVGLPPHVEEIRSADGFVSPHLPERVDASYVSRRRQRGHLDTDCPPDELAQEVADLDYVPSPDCYLQLTLSRVGALATFEPPPPWRLLGYDLTQYGISSIHNCGPWESELVPLLQRLNGYGLFSREDAAAACALLPKVWGEQEHHAFPDPSAVYEWDHRVGVRAPWRPARGQALPPPR